MGKRIENSGSDRGISLLTKTIKNIPLYCYMFYSYRFYCLLQIGEKQLYRKIYAPQKEIVQGV